MTLSKVSVGDTAATSRGHVRGIRWFRKETKSIAFATARLRLEYTRVLNSSGQDVSRGASGDLCQQFCWDPARGGMGAGSEEGGQSLGRRIPLREMGRGRMEGERSSRGKGRGRG